MATDRKGNSMEPLQIIRIETDTHRAFGSPGIFVKVAWLDDGPTARAWKLVEGGVWTRRDLRGVQRMVEEYFGF